MSKSSTPTGDRAKEVIRKIDRWLLKQEDESTLDWTYQDQVKELEKLYEQMLGLEAERKQRDREERAEQRRLARAEARQ